MPEHRPEAEPIPAGPAGDPGLEALPSLRGVEASLEPRNWRPAAIASALFHLVLFFVLKDVTLFEGRRPVYLPVLQAKQVTPIFAPYLEPTQREANRRKLNREFDANSLERRPTVQIPQGPPSTTRPAAKELPKEYQPKPAAATPKPIEAPKLLEPPRVDQQVAANKIPVAAAPGLPNGLPAPPPPPDTKPKLAFETIGSQTGTGSAPKGGDPRFNLPSSNVQEIASALSRTRSGGLMVGDGLGDGIGGIGDGANLPPSPGSTKSNLELLSDPMGVDFRPYLVRVLAMVRRNWLAVIPESARLGQRGRVVVQLSINREGRVPKLVISSPSGSQPLDRAAVAGISASNPFPPLPGEFKGEQIRVQFSFAYNAQPTLR